MIENVLNKMGGLGMYGVISICLFFAVFAGVLVWTLCLKKPYLKAMREQVFRVDALLKSFSDALAPRAPSPEAAPASFSKTPDSGRRCVRAMRQ